MHPPKRSSGKTAVETAAVSALHGRTEVTRADLDRSVLSACDQLQPTTIRSYLDDIIRTGRLLRRTERGLIGPGLEADSMTPRETSGEARYYTGFAEFLRQSEGLSRCLVVGGNVLGERGGTPDVIGRRSPVVGAVLPFGAEIVSGELKLDPLALVQGFGQACWYKLFSHQVYLAAPRTVSKAELARLEQLCRKLDVGLALFSPAGEERWELRVRPRVHPPDMALANEKLAPLRELFE